jgi:hypothetical protein
MLQVFQMARGAKAEMKVLLEKINMDTSIQCRAGINVETVSEYAESMKAGEKFPAVILFGEYIGDGWHRIMAARQAGLKHIDADCREGGRAEALKFALGANAANGLRRTNADKRRAVEIALAEFPTLSSRAIAELCGVSAPTVAVVMGTCKTFTPEPTVTGSDGKQYPASKPKMPKRPTEFKTPQEEEAFYENDQTETKHKEVQTDPLSGKVDLVDIDPKQDMNSEPPNLAGLKRYWNYANKRERKAFLEYIKEEGRL